MRPKYDVDKLTERQKQALRAAYDASEGEGFRITSSKMDLFQILRERGFEGSGAAGIMTSLRQKSDPFQVWTGEHFSLTEEATEAAMHIEVDLAACKPKATPPKPRAPTTDWAGILAEPVEPRVRAPKPRPEGYGLVDSDLDRIDPEDMETLRGREKGYIRSWNRVKRRKNG